MFWKKVNRKELVCIEESRLPAHKDGSKTVFCEPVNMDAKDFLLLVKHLKDPDVPEDQRFCFMGHGSRNGPSGRPVTVSFDLPPPSTTSAKTSSRKKMSSGKSQKSKSNPGASSSSSKGKGKEKASRASAMKSKWGRGETARGSSSESEAVSGTETPDSEAPHLTDDGSDNSSPESESEDEGHSRPQSVRTSSGRISKPPSPPASAKATSSAKTSLKSKGALTNQSLDGNPMKQSTSFKPRSIPTITPGALLLGPSTHTPVRLVLHSRRARLTRFIRLTVHGSESLGPMSLPQASKSTGL